MLIRIKTTTVFPFRSIAWFLLLFSMVLPADLIAQEVYLCVWRNPERTMTKIFPDAKDYKTVTIEIDDLKRREIEEAIGSELLPGQRDQFQYFEMKGNARNVIGTIIAGSQKGEFGAVEFVFGMDLSNTIVDIYVQRSRERDQSFKQRGFLDFFRGINIQVAGTIHEKYKGEMTPGTDAVLRGLVKELVAFQILVRDRNQK